MSREPTRNLTTSLVQGPDGSVGRLHGLQPRLFAQNRQISDPREFTLNPHEQTRKQLEILLQACRRRFREIGAISDTYQNPPCSKPWMPRLFAQNQPSSDPSEFTVNPHEQSRKQLEIHLQAWRRRFREFGAIPETPKSAMFKSWAQAFLLKIGQVLS